MVDTGTAENDHRSLLGRREGALPHIQTFLIWAKKHGCLTIGHKLLGLLLNPTEPTLLGGLLRFASYRDTHDLLKVWAPERKLLGQLTLLSEQLVDFPNIPLPTTSEPVHTQFVGQLDVNYLGVQFSTRRAPNLRSKDQLKITCLRTWLLLKALDFAEAGHRADRSLNHLCTQLRMALDDRDDGKKLSWFLATIEPNLSLAQFENSLQFCMEKLRASATGTAAENIRSIQFLLENRPRPEKMLTSEWLPPLPTFADQKDLHLEDTPWSDLPYPHKGPLILHGNDEEDELLAQEVDVDQEDTPPQAFQESRSIAFQSQEDQQYLPYSWNHLRSDELAMLREGIQLQLSSPDPKRRLLAATTALAMCTRRSMRTVETIRISSSGDEQWQLDIDNQRLHRLPSRRAVRWRQDENTKDWVRPLSDLWVIELNPAIAETLQKAARENPQAQTVGQLWGLEDPPLETSFNRWCSETPGLERVSSGLLVRQPEQAAFEKTLDHTFTRILTAPARAGIPGAGAYPSWTSTQVTQTLGLISASAGTMVSTSPDLNALGSELDPDDLLLRSALARAAQELDEVARVGTDWIANHNHLAAHGVLLLLASTGARPVASVFETILQFDLHQGLVYLEDKASRGDKDRTSGRLVPMVPEVLAFFSEIYLPHLRHLAEGVQSWLPDVSTEIELHLNGRGSEKLPLFFLFKRKPEFDWVEVSEASLRALGLIDWPLPLNLFRHRLATRLRTAGLDPELVDAQLGHAESGSETFSDVSPRCWSDERANWVQALNECMLPLEIKQPRLALIPIKKTELSPGYLPFQDEQLFGRAAREEQRAARKAAAERGAIADIERFINGRPIDSIAPTEWETLGRNMLLNEHNLRQPNATVRYQVFEDFVQREWRDHGRRPRLRKWIARMPKPQSVFLPNVIGVTQRLDAARVALDHVFSELSWPVSKSFAAQLAALDLCLYGQVSADKVIEGLASADTSCIRLVLFDGCAYIEYSEWLDRVDNAPVQRFLLPSRSARYADLALSAGKSLEKMVPLPVNLGSIVEALGAHWLEKATLSGLLRSLSKDVRQENTLTLPGVVAGVLAGTLPSSALPWSDWIRVTTGQARTNPKATDAETSETSVVKEDELITPRTAIGVVSLRDREHSKVANRAFLGEIRSVLNDYLLSRKQSQKTAEGEITRNIRTNSDTAARRHARSALERILKKPDPAVSVTVYALGTWVLHLLYRPYRKGFLDAASIRRYMDALSHGFVSFGHCVDLADLDGDELTEFYRDILDGSKDGETNAADEGDNDEPATHKGRRNEKYVLQRLEEFHRFASVRFGLESPDWAEIGDGAISSLSNPGTICEREYLQALQLLCPDPFSDGAKSVRDAFVLLLAYRFGLRGGEVIGLRNKDWVNISGALVVIVAGKHRQLKTRGSQRQVPLIERLTEQEQLIIHRWLAHWSTETGNDQTIPLFFDDKHRKQATEIQPIRARILTALRTATRNKRTTLHQTRHSFANRAFQYLVLEKKNEIWANHHNQNTETGSSAKLAVLSTGRATRRSSWALARLLGHASHSTTFGSYLHVHFDWASQCVSGLNPDRFEKIALRTTRSAIDLDKWIVVPSNFQLIPITSEHKHEICTPSRVLKYWRLRAQGYPSRAAADLNQLSPSDALKIETTLAEIGKRLSENDDGDKLLSSISLPLALLGRIQQHRWQPLIEFIQAREASAIAHPFRDYEPSQQIGRSRQLLLWSEDHFAQLRGFMQWMAFQDHQIDTFCPRKIDPKTVEWARTYGFAKLMNTHSAEGKKTIQIDLAVEKFDNRPAVIHPSRVAAVINAATPILKDNYEFFLIWAAFTLSQASISSEGTLMHSKDTSS